MNLFIYLISKFRLILDNKMDKNYSNYLWLLFNKNNINGQSIKIEKNKYKKNTFLFIIYILIYIIIIINDNIYITYKNIKFLYFSHL